MGRQLFFTWGALSALLITPGFGCQVIGGIDELHVTGASGAGASGAGGAGTGAGVGAGASSSSSGAGGALDDGGTAEIKAVWAKSFGNSSEQMAADVAVDANGNIYIVGSFLGTMNVGPALTLTSAGDYDAFIVKLDPSGTFIWAKSFGGAMTDKAASVAVGPDGRLYVTGEFTDSATIDMTTLIGESTDGFLLALDVASGAAAWAKTLGGPGEQRGRSVEASVVSKRVFCAGEAAGTLNIEQSSTKTAGLEDLFLVQYDFEGVHNSTLVDGDAMSQSASAMAFGPSGELFLAADFDGQFPKLGQFGTAPSAGGGDVFLFKAPPGQPISWAFRFGDASLQRANGLAATPDGHVVMAGVFEGAFDVNGTMLASTGNRDAFVIEFGSGGGLKWLRSFGDSSDSMVAIDDQEATDVAIDEIGNLYVTGFAAGSVDFGPSIEPEAGDTDLFLVKLSSAGQTLWATRSGGADTQAGRAIAYDPAGNVIVVGDFRGALELGNGPLKSMGGRDVFIAKIPANP